MRLKLTALFAPIVS